MPWKTSALFVLFVLVVIISMTSTTEARSRHLRHKSRNGGGSGGGGGGSIEDRPRGRRHRLYNNNYNDDADDSEDDDDDTGGLPSRRHHPHQRQHNQSTPGYPRDGFRPAQMGLVRGGRGQGRRGRKASVPSLHDMQMLALRPSGGKTRQVGGDGPEDVEDVEGVEGVRERRPIRGSRKAVVVTKKTYLKKEWCKTQPLKQVIRMRGCLRTKMVNNFCYGQCNSFFIPKRAPARGDRGGKRGGDPAFLSCGFCRPRRSRWVLVTLRCPGRHGMRYRRKRVRYVKKCRCMAQDVTLSPV